MNKKEEQYKKWYKIFYNLGGLVLADFILISIGWPSFAKLVLAPILNFVFPVGITESIIGFYMVSWIIFFIPAIILKRKIKKLEK